MSSIETEVRGRSEVPALPEPPAVATPRRPHPLARQSAADRFFSSVLRHATLLIIGAGAIGSLSLYTMNFANTCRSDGCIGIVFGVGAILLALGVQLIVLVPADIYRTRNRGEPYVLRAVWWVALSLTAAIGPLLFAI